MIYFEKIDDPDGALLNGFIPTELYLGFNMDSNNIKICIQNAKKINEDIKIYKVGLKTNSYDLQIEEYVSFEEISETKL